MREADGVGFCGSSGSVLLPTMGKKGLLPEVVLVPRAHAERFNPSLDHGGVSGAEVCPLGETPGGWPGPIPFLGGNRKDLR